MIEFHVYPARTYFEGPEAELEQMFEPIRVKDKNAYWKVKTLIRRLAYLRHLPSGERDAKVEQIRMNMQYIKFYERRSDTFGTGLLGLVKAYLRRAGILFRVEDHRKPLPGFLDSEIKFKFKDKIEDRPEQVAVLKKALKRGCGILHCSTNFGKTEVAAAIIDMFRRKVGHWPKVLFLVHRKGLAEQTQKRFKKHLDVPIAMVGAGKKKAKAITVATVQTAVRLMTDVRFRKLLRECDIVFIDELHVNRAKQIRKVMNKCSARMRFGLSGTVSREEVKMLTYRGLVGPIIAEVRSPELIALGRSAQPLIRMVMVDADIVTGNYAFSYRNGIVHNIRRNELVAKETARHVRKDRKVLVTVGRIKHGHILLSRLEGLNLECEFISGSTPMSVRRKVIRKFQKGRLHVLIASPIFDTGMDIPEIGAWCNAAGGKGWELVLQRLGRTLRRKPGRNLVYISDFVDKHSRYLLNHSMRRWDYYLEEGAKVKVVGGTK